MRVGVACLLPPEGISRQHVLSFRLLTQLWKVSGEIFHSNQIAEFSQCLSSLYTFFHPHSLDCLNCRYMTSHHSLAASNVWPIPTLSPGPWCKNLQNSRYLILIITVFIAISGSFSSKKRCCTIFFRFFSQLLPTWRNVFLADRKCIRIRFDAFLLHVLSKNAKGYEDIRSWNRSWISVCALKCGEPAPAWPNFRANPKVGSWRVLLSVTTDLCSALLLVQ